MAMFYIICSRHSLMLSKSKFIKSHHLQKRDIMVKKTSSKLSFRSLEEQDIIEIHKRQNNECTRELAEVFDNRPRWSLLSLAQIKESLAEEQKKQHTTLFSIYAGEEFVGVGEWSGRWDTWAPYSWFIIWPEHRQRGHGTEVARTLLDRCFLENPGHVVTSAANEWNKAATSFLRSFGFKEIGKMRQVGMEKGKYFDLLFFDLLKSEYLGKDKGVRK